MPSSSWQTTWPDSSLRPPRFLGLRRRSSGRHGTTGSRLHMEIQANEWVGPSCLPEGGDTSRQTRGRCRSDRRSQWHVERRGARAAEARGIGGRVRRRRWRALRRDGAVRGRRKRVEGRSRQLDERRQGGSTNCKRRLASQILSLVAPVCARRPKQRKAGRTAFGRRRRDRADERDLLLPPCCLSVFIVRGLCPLLALASSDRLLAILDAQAHRSRSSPVAVQLLPVWSRLERCLGCCWWCWCWWWFWGLLAGEEPEHRSSIRPCLLAAPEPGASESPVEVRLRSPTVGPLSLGRRVATTMRRMTCSFVRTGQGIDPTTTSSHRYDRRHQPGFKERLTTRFAGKLLPPSRIPVASGHANLQAVSTMLSHQQSSALPGRSEPRKVHRAELGLAGKDAVGVAQEDGAWRLGLSLAKRAGMGTDLNAASRPTGPASRPGRPRRASAGGRGRGTAPSGPGSASWQSRARPY